LNNPYFVFVEHILEGSSAQNLTKVIMSFLFNASGLTKVEVPSRLLCFGVDGVSTFQGAEGGVIVQIQDLHVPFLRGIHYMAHMINLVVHIFFSLPIVAYLKDLLQSIYTCFCESQIFCHLEH
jgi:hypothetical protein